jgi:cysteine-rich repeat protein
MTGWNGHLECDDGNSIDDDGCSNIGTVTPGYICKSLKLGEPDVC